MKKICSLLLTTALVLGMTTISHASESRPHFTDVPESFWAYTYIERAYAEGVVSGTSGDPAQYTGLFSPNQTLTNAQFATILTQGFFAEELDMSTGEYWYTPYITTLQKHGLLAGTSVETQPNAIATRYEMSIIMTELLRYEGIAMPSEVDLQNASNHIGDWSSVPAAYQESVATVYALHLISGINDQGDFAGESGVTRAAMCTIYCNLSDLLRPGNNTGTVVNEYYPNTNCLTYTSVIGVPLKRSESNEDGASFTYECDVNGQGLDDILAYTDYLVAENFSLLGEVPGSNGSFGFIFAKRGSNSSVTSISIMAFPNTNEVMVIVAIV